MNLGELDWQFVFSLVAATGVLVAAIYHIMILRYNMRARAMEIIRLHMSDIISEQGVQRDAIVRTMEWKDYEDFINKYWAPAREPEIFSKWVSYFFMLEATGLLIKNKVVKAELFYEIGASSTIETWEKFKDVIQRMRKDPTLFKDGGEIFSNAEFLAQEL